MDFFHKRGNGGLRSNPKLLGHNLGPNKFGILGRKGGTVDQIQKFWGSFPQIFGELGHKKVPQKFQKNWTFGKVPQKFQHSWKRGAGGFRPVLEEVHN